MRKNIVVAILLLGLVAALAAPAGAKKKKKVKPYKSETVTIQAGHPAFYSTSGTIVSVTAQEFFQTCSVPQASNGVDAYVFEVPKAYQKITASIEAIGESVSPAGYDLDLYLYDKACKNVGVYNAAGTDEYGVLAKGTSFIVLHAYAGNPVDAFVTLKPLK
jgi:hypothetical protein